MTGVFRDPARTRSERVAELRGAIGGAEKELASLNLEVEELSAAQGRQLSPHKAKVAHGAHVTGLVAGVVCGLPIVYVLWVLLYPYLVF